MPLAPQSFQILSPQQANPFAYGMRQGADIGDIFSQTLLRQLQARQISQKLPYEVQALQQQNQERQPYATNANQWYNAQLQNALSKNQLQQGQAQQASTEADINRKKSGNPNLYLTQGETQLATYGTQQSGGQPQQQSAPQDQGNNPPPTPGVPPGGTEPGTAPVSGNPQPGTALGSALQSALGQGNALGQGATPTAGNPDNTGDPVNSPYGIPKPPEPTYSPNPMVQKLLLANHATPEYKASIENWKSQVNDQYGLYQKASTDAASASTAATGMSRSIDLFNNAMDQANYTGGFLGKTSTSGLAALLPGNGGAEQKADRYAVQIQRDMIPAMAEDMKNSKFSNADLNMLGRLKVDRTLDKGARSQLSETFNAINERINQHADFITAAANPAVGLTEPQAQELWANYQKYRPLYDDQIKGIDHAHLNSWQEFLSPQAIQSVKTKGFYEPPITDADIDATVAASGGKLKRADVISRLKNESRL